MIMIDVFENYENLVGSQFHGQEEGIARKLQACCIVIASSVVVGWCVVDNTFNFEIIAVVCQSWF